MIRKALIHRLLDALTIQRWNDQSRPQSLVDIYKNGHKMTIAYRLARCAAEDGQAVEWHNIVHGGPFELLCRAVLSDIKAPIYRKSRSKYAEMCREIRLWRYQQMEARVLERGVPGGTEGLPCRRHTIGATVAADSCRIACLRKLLRVSDHQGGNTVKREDTGDIASVAQSSAIHLANRS
jgi:hypothetical protein